MMDDLSIMTETADIDLNRRIGARVHTLRTSRGQSLEGLAQKSGVSRSMLSLIERGETSATATVLEKVAAGLDVSLASLFEKPNPGPADPVSRRADQAQWRDPASGYVRRNVSPDGVGSPIKIVEVTFPPNAHVAYETGARDFTVHQQVWVLDGAIEVTVGDETHVLKAGDCVAYRLDRPTGFHNRTTKNARYVVVLARFDAARGGI